MGKVLLLATAILILPASQVLAAQPVRLVRVEPTIEKRIDRAVEQLAVLADAFGDRSQRSAVFGSLSLATRLWDLAGPRDFHRLWVDLYCQRTSELVGVVRKGGVRGRRLARAAFRARKERLRLPFCVAEAGALVATETGVRRLGRVVDALQRSGYYRRLLRIRRSVLPLLRRIERPFRAKLRARTVACGGWRTSVPPLATLLNQLGMRRTSVRRRAMRWLRAMGPRVVPAVLEAIRRDRKNKVLARSAATVVDKIERDSRKRRKKR